MPDLLRLPDVMRRTGHARSTVYLMVERGLLPKAVKISERASAWPSDEIDAVNAARIAGKGDDDVRKLIEQLERNREELEKAQRRIERLPNNA
jgi:prophage regulatory protein